MGQSSALKAAGNIFIAVVGAGVLGLPYAFAKSGLVLGVSFLTFVASLALYSMLLLAQCKRCAKHVINPIRVCTRFGVRPESGINPRVPTGNSTVLCSIIRLFHLQLTNAASTAPLKWCYCLQGPGARGRGELRRGHARNPGPRRAAPGGSPPARISGR